MTLVTATFAKYFIRWRDYLVALTIFASVVALFLTGQLSPLDTSLRDWRFSFDARSVSGEIVAIDIDTESIQALSRWPISRDNYATALDILLDAGAQEIAFDIDFSTHSVAEDDERFAAALERAGGAAILAVFKQKPNTNNEGEFYYNAPIEEFAANTWPASVNVIVEPDGLVRRFPVGDLISGEPVQSIAAVLAGYSGSLEGEILVDFSIDPGTLQRYSLASLLNGKVPSEELRGKRVVIGASALELRDFFSVPKHGVISGHTLQIIAAETLLQNRALQRLEPLWIVLGLMVLSGLLLLATRNQGWARSTALVLTWMLTTEISAQYLQTTQALSLETASLHLSFILCAIYILLKELDVRKFLLSVSINETRNTKHILDRVIADNFDGVMVVTQDKSIHSMSMTARQILSEIGSNVDTTASFDEIAPREFLSAIEDAFQNVKKNIAHQSSPLVFDREFNGVRKVIEYIVTPSSLMSKKASKWEKGRKEHIVCISFRDITEKRLSQERLSYLASYDQTTGLPNRALLENKITLLTENCDQNEICGHIFRISVSRYQRVKTTLGHEPAEHVLLQMADRLSVYVTANDYLACIGEGEFALVFSELVQEHISLMADTIIDEISKPYSFSGLGAVVGADIGIAPIGAGLDAQVAIRNADTALSQAKERNGNQFAWFDDNLMEQQWMRHSLEIDLWKALDRDQFSVFFQPQINLATGELYGAEALVRWMHQDRGAVSPGAFIEIAEESAMIAELGAWVLEKSCDEATSWPDHLKVAVNVSPLQFAQGNLKDVVSTALDLSGLKTDRLELEITESLFIEDSDRILKIIQDLRAMGISFALDDFGTGYSSLGYISNFPLDKIKIDQSFLRDIETKPESQAIVRAVTGLAQGMNLTTVAEGIETEAQGSFARLAGCALGQGYLYSRPLAAEQMRAFITDFNANSAPLEEPAQMVG